MATETENIVLGPLRRIRATVDVMAAELRRTNSGVNLTVHGHGSLVLSDAAQNAEIERLKVRLERAEKRLERRD